MERKETCKRENHRNRKRERERLFHCLFAVNCNLEYNLYISRGKEMKREREKEERMMIIMMMPTFIFTHHLLLSFCPFKMYTNSYIQWMNQTLFQFIPSPFLCLSSLSHFSLSPSVIKEKNSPVFKLSLGKLWTFWNTTETWLDILTRRE